ncbi:radical SAM protein [Fastidiosibacter lacustris]|uniref:radical SAM protein n=1 Tax=Fastidiosibacter lacustris TaxID=2056695 RepID=UPI0013008414|nr:radical SAM protein [Fastidiosibacter lacustris]
MFLVFVRPPQADHYNSVSTQEDPIITSFLGFVDNHVEGNHECIVKDFVLNPDLSSADYLLGEDKIYIIVSRERGSVPHYAVRLAENVKKHYPKASVNIYGQIATASKKLRKYINTDINFVIHSEMELAKSVGLTVKSPYIHSIHCKQTPYYMGSIVSKEKEKLFTAAIETTRGCVYKCDFCFVNNFTTFPSRWSTRSNSLIISDIDTYYKEGIRKFFFFDLEFLGANKKFHKERKELLRLISIKFPDINFMIYCRADTLELFNDYDLLKKAGLYNVYMGAESFYQSDLDQLNKHLKSETIKASVINLLDRDINIFLSMIPFNRNTTILSLKHNIKTLNDFMTHENASCLRVQTILLNIEHSWDNKGLEKYLFSDMTYTKWTMYFRSQNTNKYVFNTEFEPLIEVLRSLSYENEKKSTELNFAYLHEIKPIQKGIEAWFANLDKFSLYLANYYVGEFEKGSLKMSKESIKKNQILLFEMIDLFNQRFLPKRLSETCTKNETILTHDGNKVYIGDHGFDEVIPPLSEYHAYVNNINMDVTE